MTQDNKFAADYSLSDAEIVSARGLKLAEPPRFAKKYGSEKSYEPLSLSIWQNLIQDGDVVCDVGAHHGIYSLLAAHSGMARAVFAYEPSKENAAFIENNAKMNKLNTKITIRKVALSNKVGSVRFQITEASDNANIEGHPNSPTLKAASVKMSTIDNDFHNSKLDLIKIDTDGYEPYILDGAVNTFKANPQLKMLIEFNPKCLIRNKYSPLRFFERLIEFNFELFLVDDNKSSITQVTNSRAVWREIENTPFFFNILCLPTKDKKAIKMFKKIIKKLQSEGEVSEVKFDKRRFLF